VNAPANIKREIIAEAWSPIERAHRGTISVHCPNEDEWAMKCRVAIAMMRDQAAAAQRQCCDGAHGILGEVARVATTAVYAPSDAKRLTLMRSALVQAMDAARAIERASRNG
jgi:hypothetical protein